MFGNNGHSKRESLKAVKTVLCMAVTDKTKIVLEKIGPSGHRGTSTIINVVKYKQN